ncbi:hypothetical protein LCGC14_2470940 [marine sediment metagenome]|uniref:Uncharacterized protein n=1 Tax=marine sediment metagenome TaxID=412755 RepID=A0A0F9DMH4_9ZZZZ
MVITVVCAHCRHHEKEPIIEINFRDGLIYFMCPECKKESKISLKAESKPLPKLRSLR